MPRSYQRRARRMRGAGFADFVKKAGKWLSKTRLLSKVAKAVSYAYPQAAGVSKGLASLGLGRRPKTRPRRAMVYSYTGL